MLFGKFLLLFNHFITKSTVLYQFLNRPRRELSFILFSHDRDKSWKASTNGTVLKIVSVDLALFFLTKFQFQTFFLSCSQRISLGLCSVELYTISFTSGISILSPTYCGKRRIRQFFGEFFHHNCCCYC